MVMPVSRRLEIGADPNISRWVIKENCRFGFISPAPALAPGPQVKHTIGRRTLSLIETFAPNGLDRLQAQRTVRSRAREDYSDGPWPLIFRQRPQEMIDWRVFSGWCRAARKMKHPLDSAYVHVWRDYVDMVGTDWHAILHVRDGHLGSMGKQLGEDAFMSGFQVLHHDKCHADLRWT
jgi:hypothetical protein